MINKIIIFAIIFILIAAGIIWFLDYFFLGGISSWWCELKMNTDSKWCQHKEDVEVCEALCLEEVESKESNKHKGCIDSCLNKLNNYRDNSPQD